MGNNTSNYIAGENFDSSSSSEYEPVDIIKTPTNPFHKKGKPYGVILDIKLNCNEPNDWACFVLYDLRTGNKSNWWLNVNVYGNELEFKLHIVDKTNKDLRMYELRYSSESNMCVTVLKGRTLNYYVRLELYADNIHCQRIHTLKNFKPVRPIKIWGFIQFDNQDKIPIAFG